MRDLPFCVLIPTRDSARFTPHVLRAYRRLGVEPFYIVDPRSVDETAKLLEASAARYRIFQPSDTFIEAGTLSYAAEVVPSDWILRLDDDEFPSDTLLQWAAEQITKRKAKAWGIPRLNLFKRDETIYYSQSARTYDRRQRRHINNPQFRLYEKSSVEYKEALHTPGFVLKDWAYAPAEAYIAHFDTLLKPFEQRLDKVRRYEATRAGCGWVYADHYLPELFTLEELDARVYTGEISAVIADLPLAERSNEIVISNEDMRHVRDSAALREENAMRLTFESRDDLAARLARALPTSIATAPVGEFICTIGRFLRIFGLRPPIEAFGSAVYERSAFNRIAARNPPLGTTP